MKKQMQDDRLVFMISMPRSGSTLLQKILGEHSDIYTRSEPWLMLHPLHALKGEGIQARYNAKVAAAGVQDFVSGIPGKDESFYYESIRNCYLSLYQPYLETSGKSRFLDKTPRYYEIFDELQKTFPNAKFIILYRNPLAVLASILKTWVRGNYSALKEYSSDLCEGVEFLQRDFSSYANTHVVRYESLLLNPESEITLLFNFLELPNQPKCIDYGNKNNEQWMYGDPVTVYKNSRPDAQHANAWHKQLVIAEHRKLLSDYLQTLGRSGFERLGYSFDDTLDIFAKIGQETPAPELEMSLCDLLRSDTESAQRIKELNTEVVGLGESLKKSQQQNADAQNESNRYIEETQKLSAALQELENRFAEVKSERDRFSEDTRAASVAIKMLEDTLQRENSSAQLKDIKLKELNERILHTYTLLEKSNGYSREQHVALENCNKQLSKTQDKLEDHEFKIAKLEELLASLLRSAEKLTKKRAILHPIAKLQAYKELLGNFVFARKHLRQHK